MDSWQEPVQNKKRLLPMPKYKAQSSGGKFGPPHPPCFPPPAHVVRHCKIQDIPRIIYLFELADLKASPRRRPQIGSLEHLSRVQDPSQLDFVYRELLACPRCRNRTIFDISLIVVYMN